MVTRPLVVFSLAMAAVTMAMAGLTPRGMAQTAGLHGPPPQAAGGSGVGADFYRSHGFCIPPVARGKRVTRGSAVPSGPGHFLLERGGTYQVTPRSDATFGAFGTGHRPRINAQSLAGLARIRYDEVQVPQIWGGSAGASGRISVTNSRLGGTSISINTTSQADEGPAWDIVCNDLGSAGLGPNSDSCILALSPGTTIVGNAIAGCGDGTGYGKHGVYAKASDVRMGFNTVSSIGGGADGGQAFSLRYPGARVDHNIYDGTGSDISAVGFFGQSTSTSGTMVVAHNDFRTVALWLDPYDTEGNPFDWMIRRNTVRPVEGESVFVRGGSINASSTWRITNNDLTGFSSVNSLDPCPGLLVRRGNTGTNAGNCR